MVFDVCCRRVLLFAVCCYCVFRVVGWLVGWLLVLSLLFCVLFVVCCVLRSICWPFVVCRSLFVVC